MLVEVRTGPLDPSQSLRLERTLEVEVEGGGPIPEGGEGGGLRGRGVSLLASQKQEKFRYVSTDTYIAHLSTYRIGEAVELMGVRHDHGLVEEGRGDFEEEEVG